MIDLGIHPIRVLAPNPGPFTLEGTNTWIVGRDPSMVIDPGPDDPGHVRAVLRQAGTVHAVLLTHRHPDHAPGAARLAAAAGAPVMALRPSEGERRLAAGQVIEAGGVRLRAVPTPGHTPDHVVFHLDEPGALFTGDAVLGRGTSVVDPPEGDMAAYLRSLGLMRSLAPRVLYPGHGPVVWDAEGKLREYVEHRRMREEQVLEALKGGPRSPGDLVPVIYAGYADELRPLASRSLLAHLVKLESEGKVVRVGATGSDRFALASPAECRRCGRPVRQEATLCDRCRLAVLQESPRGPASPGDESPA